MSSQNNQGAKRAKMDGFIQIPRSFFDSPYWRKSASRKGGLTESEAMLDMMEQASFRDREVNLWGGTIALVEGEILGSIDFLAKRWRWDPGKISKFLTKLRNQRIIESRDPSWATTPVSNPAHATPPRVHKINLNAVFYAKDTRKEHPSPTTLSTNQKEEGVIKQKKGIETENLPVFPEAEKQDRAMFQDDDVVHHAFRLGYSTEIAHAFCARNPPSNRYTLKSWQRAFEGYAEKFTRPTRHKMSKRQFLACLKRDWGNLDLIMEFAPYWWQKQEDSGWTTINRNTGRTEYIKDPVNFYLGYYQYASEERRFQMLTDMQMAVINKHPEMDLDEDEDRDSDDVPF